MVRQYISTALRSGRTETYAHTAWANSRSLGLKTFDTFLKTYNYSYIIFMSVSYRELFSLMHLLNDKDSTTEVFFVIPNIQTQKDNPCYSACQMMCNRNKRFHVCEARYEDNTIRALPIEELMRTKNAFRDWISSKPWSYTINNPGLLFACDNYYMAGHESQLDVRLKVVSMNNGGINGLPKDQSALSTDTTNGIITDQKVNGTGDRYLHPTV